MNIETVTLLPGFADKLLGKHRVEPDEVWEIFTDAPVYRFIEKGDREGEDLYAGLGQTEAGRYLIMFFLYKRTLEALVISGRDMAEAERRWYVSRRKSDS